MSRNTQVCARARTPAPLHGLRRRSGGILEGLVRRADPDGAKRYREVSLSGMAGIDRSDGKRSGRGQIRSEPMQYRSMEQIGSEADVFTIPSLSRRDRLERWAEALARHPARLSAIPEVEYGPRRERDARRADHSPLTVAYEDPLLRAAGLRGDTIGDAAELFRPLACAVTPSRLLLPSRVDHESSGHCRAGSWPDAARGGMHGRDHLPRCRRRVSCRAHGCRGACGRAFLMLASGRPPAFLLGPSGRGEDLLRERSARRGGVDAGPISPATTITACGSLGGKQAGWRSRLSCSRCDADPGLVCSPGSGPRSDDAARARPGEGRLVGWRPVQGYRHTR